MAKIFLSLIYVVFAWPAFGQDLKPYITQNGTVHFTSDAPLELIEASSNELQGAIDPTSNTFAFRIEISSFEGFNSSLQRTHFNENYMESNLYRTATFVGKIIDKVDLAVEGLYFIRSKGELDIHGVKRERIIKSTVKVAEGKILVHSRFTVLLEEHDIDVPKVIQQKIATEILVNMEAELLMQKM